MMDILKLSERLTTEEILIRDQVRKFVDQDVIPHMVDAFEQGTFPMSLVKGLADLGLFGMTLPEKWGGSEASQVAYGLVCQELERGDSGLRSFVSVQSSLCMYPIFQFGSEVQKETYLNAMAKGEFIGCFGLTEPDTGSDPANMKTRAVKVDGGWKLNGSKMWITNATIADVAIVWAKVDDGFRGFLVDKDTPGFTTKEIKHKMSLRASITGELVFDDCFISDDKLLPGSDIGLQAPLSCLTKARYGIAWGVMGAAMACYETALSYTKERVQFDKPVASFQLVQKDLVDMLCEITKANAFNLQLGRLHDQNEHDYVMVSMAKMNACQQALNIARMARNLLGANGISLEYPVIRHMNNLESVYTYEGTDNMHHLIIGRHITGLSAFS